MYETNTSRRDSTTESILLSILIVFKHNTFLLTFLFAYDRTLSLRNKSRVKLLDYMLVKESEIVQYFNKKKIFVTLNLKNQIQYILVIL